MATTVSGLSEAQLDDQLITAIRSKLPFVELFSTRLDFAGEGLVKGNTYIVPVQGVMNVSDKTPGTLVASSGSLTGASVVANGFKGVSWSAAEGGISARLLANWFAQQIPLAVAQVGGAIVDAAIGLLTSTNFTQEVTDAAFDLDTVAELRKAAHKKLKDMPGAFLCGPDVAAELSKVQPVAEILALVEKHNVYTDGRIPGSVIGYDAFEYRGWGSTACDAAVVGKGAIALVAGAPEQIISAGSGNVVYRRLIEDPESGLTLQYTEAVDAGGTITGEVACVYGVAKATDNAVLFAFDTTTTTQG